MANYTPNINLYKPNRVDTEEVDVTLSDNFEKIDTEFKNHKDQLEAHLNNTDSAHEATAIPYQDPDGNPVNVKVALDTLDGKVKANESDINTLETRVDNIVVEGGNSNPEIVDARGSFTTLKGRMDSTDAQLADVEKQKADLTYVDTKTAAIASGSPKGTYATLSALQTAFPTGNTNTYVITADGKWYYWNGSAWTAGGVYQSTGIADGSVTKEKINGATISPNLLNKETVKRGYTVTQAGEAVQAGWNCSDFIPVEPNGKYTATYALGTFAIYYDANKQYIFTRTVSTGTAGYVLTNLSNAYYVRINFQDAYLENYMFVKGEVLPAQYSPYGTTIDWLTFKDKTIKSNHLETLLQTQLTPKWKGKKIVTFGDSITWYDGRPFENTHIEQGQTAKGYQSYMREQFQCTVDNQGYSGAHIKLISSSKIKGYASYLDVDAVTITSGANDHRIGFAPGTVQPIGSVFNLDTYAGAFQDAIEYLLAQKPSLKIYLITPIKGWYTAETSTRYNGENIISKTYISIMKQVAELYSLPILDWYHLSGINEKTYYVNGQPYYIGDNPAVWTAYQLHPTNSGYKRMADILLPFLNNH